jgi:sugar O-acyltransferase (sialic acid O-acetyltransferase NeuD family)
MKPLILIGGGGHCKSVIEATESAGYIILGILDKPEEVGKTVLSTKVIGVDDDIPQFVDKAEFMVTVGFIKNPSLRIALYERVKNAGGVMANVIANTAHVSRYAKMGGGISIFHKAMVNAGATIGNNVIINTSAVIEHDAVVGDHTHISTGAIVNGEAKIGKRCFIGSQAVIANCISICDDAIIGAGSVVVKDIIEPGTYVGNPAKRIKDLVT